MCHSDCIFFMCFNNLIGKIIWIMETIKIKIQICLIINKLYTVFNKVLEIKTFISNEKKNTKIT